MSRPAILLLLLSLCCLGLAGRGALSRPARDARAEPAASPNEVLVALSPGLAALDAPALERRLGGRVLDSLSEIHTVRLGLEPEETVSQAIARIGRLPGVVNVEPNLLLRESTAPNDTFYGGQASYLELIGAPAAWERAGTGDDSVIVAVLDSGVDIDHPDLQGRIWTNPLEIAGNGIDDDENGCIDDVHGCTFVSVLSRDPSCADPVASIVMDDAGHGTFVAGIIAASSDNDLGITGAAPGVTIAAVKILDCKGGGTASEAAKGILYAAHIGARVINLSFGADGESLTLANAIAEAHDRYGVVIVAASGNAGTPGVNFPARLDDAIAVGASGSSEGHDARSSFSDWGPEVDVVAPGNNIISTVPMGLCGTVWACVNEQPYSIASGTSFAAPLVSALAALVISHYPNLSPEAVRQIIASSADPLEDGNAPLWDGAGRIRMNVALEQPRYQIGVPGALHQ